MKLSAEELGILNLLSIPGNYEILSDFAELAYQIGGSTANVVEDAFEDARVTMSREMPSGKIQKAFQTPQDFGDLDLDRAMLLRIKTKALRLKQSDEILSKIDEIINREFPGIAD